MESWSKGKILTRVLDPVADSPLRLIGGSFLISLPIPRPMEPGTD